MKYGVVPCNGEAASMTARPEPLMVATRWTLPAEACCDEPTSAAITKIAVIRVRSRVTMSPPKGPVGRANGPGRHGLRHDGFVIPNGCLLVRRRLSAALAHEPRDRVGDHHRATRLVVRLVMEPWIHATRHVRASVE